MLWVYLPDTILAGDFTLLAGTSLSIFCFSIEPRLFYPRLLLTDGGFDLCFTALDLWSVCLGDSNTGLSLWLTYFSMLDCDFTCASEPLFDI